MSAEKNTYYKHITSKHNPLDLKLKEVWQYRDLIILFTKRNFQVRYKQTILGPAWLFINPIISSLIYCFIFGEIAGMSTDGVPQILFYMSGNAIWTYFSSSVTRNATSFTSNAGVFGKVYFPRLTVPLSNIASSIIEFGIQMIMVLVFMIYYFIRGDIRLNFFAWPIIVIVLIHLGLMGMGCGIIISSLTTKYRDLSILVGFGIQLWMYITPIVYPLSQTDNPLLKTILLINPVTSSVELFRFVFLGQGSIHPLYLIWSWIFMLAVLIIGIMIFNKVEKTFMDTV